MGVSPEGGRQPPFLFLAAQRHRSFMPQTSDVILTRLMSLHPKIIDLTLDRMYRLLETLGHPERNIPAVIHIAGTNGKGSTQAMIRAGLEAMGKTVHAYTSPHLARFHERIRLAGEIIPESTLAALLDECEAANDGMPITFFEITTCAALLAFARTKADYTLLEVGLGGRLDATNVIDRPALTIITPVSIDHQQYLGDTLEEIAGEKAGILKRGVPCVVGPQQDAGLAVIESRAARLGAPLLASGQHWHATEERGRLIFQDESGLLDLPLPNLPGPTSDPERRRSPGRVARTWCRYRRLRGRRQPRRMARTDATPAPWAADRRGTTG